MPSADPVPEPNRTLRILATLTVFNDYPAAGRCLEALARQTVPLAGILLIDNSPKPEQAFRLAREEEWGTRLIYRSHPENIGVAGALREAFVLAREMDVDGLWTFDQDSEPEPACLAALLRDWQATVPPAVRGPVIREIPGGRIHYGGRFEAFRFRQMKALTGNAEETSCDLIITAGMLIPATLLRTWAGPPPEMFIDAVDTLICTEALARGHRVVIRHDAALHHRFGQPKITRPGKTPLHDYSPVRCYYIGRNHTLLEMRLARGAWAKVRCLLYRCRVALRFSRNAFRVRSAQPWACSKAIWKGTWHGLRHLDDPRIDLSPPARKR